MDPMTAFARSSAFPKKEAKAKFGDAIKSANDRHPVGKSARKAAALAILGEYGR